MMRLLLISIAVLSLIACTERDQSITGSTVKSDGKPWQGAKDDFVAGGWTPGDRSSWEKQIRTRTQNQNESVRMQ